MVTIEGGFAVSLERIRLAKRRTIGKNQTTKVLQQESALLLLLARDAETRVTQPTLALAENKGIPVVWIDSMKELGKACGIEVGAAMAAILEE
jgi:large subunit ribosomal protein L7A